MQWRYWTLMRRLGIASRNLLRLERVIKIPCCKCKKSNVDDLSKVYLAFNDCSIHVLFIGLCMLLKPKCCAFLYLPSMTCWRFFWKLIKNLGKGLSVGSTEVVSDVIYHWLKTPVYMWLMVWREKTQIICPVKQEEFFWKPHGNLGNNRHFNWPSGWLPSCL